MAVEALDRGFAHIAHSALDLHAFVGDAGQCLRGEELRRGGAELAIGLCIPALRGGEDERLGGGHLGVDIGEHRLDELEAGDRLPTLFRIGGEAHRFVEDADRLADADRGDVQASLVERGHGRVEALLLLAADEVGGRNADVVEEDLRGPRAGLAHFVIVRPDGHALGLRGYEEDGNALRAGGVRVGAGEDYEDIGGLGIGDEPLGTVDDVVIAVADSLRPQARGVGAGLGLSEGEGGDDLSGGQPGQPFGLLVVGAVVDEHLSGDAVVRAEQRAERRSRVAELHRQECVLFRIEAEAAVLLRQSPAEEAHLGGFFDDGVGERVLVLDLGFEGDDLLADEFADGGEDVVEF